MIQSSYIVFLEFFQNLSSQIFKKRVKKLLFRFFYVKQKNKKFVAIFLFCKILITSKSISVSIFIDLHQTFKVLWIFTDIY